MNSSAPIDSEKATEIESVGLSLRRARESHSKSREDAAQEINLRLDQLDALEHDQFDRLSGDAFVRGYLRTYARWLKLDVDQVLANYIKQTGASETVSLSRDLNTRAPIDTGSDNKKIVSAAIAVGLCIFGFWLYNANRESITEPTMAGNETTVDTFSGQPLEETSLGQAGLDEAGPTNQETAQESEALPSEASSEWQNPFTSAAETTTAAGLGDPVASTEQAIAPVLAPQVSQQASQAPSANVAAAQAATPFSSGITTRGSGPDELLFHFSEDCWLEIKNDDGRKLYSAARQAGQSLLLKGTAPFYVLVGNAPGVQLSFNGKEVEVRSRNSRNSARLTLRNSR